MLAIMDVVKPQANGKTLTFILGDGRGRVVGLIELDEHDLKKYWLRAKNREQPDSPGDDGDPDY